MVNRQAGVFRQFHQLFSLGAIGGTTDAELLAGDIMVHGEVAYPEEEPDVAPDMVGDGTPDGEFERKQMVSD